MLRNTYRQNAPPKKPRKTLEASLKKTLEKLALATSLETLEIPI